MTAQRAMLDKSSTPFLRARRRSLLLGGACGAALALAAPAEQANAQAFQGTESVGAGSFERVITGTGTETIQLFSDSAVINWTPNDNQGTGNINFLPVGNTATFENGDSGLTDFSVLNRILPSDSGRIVELNGAVVSQLQTQAGTVRGGTVAFYTPGGIIVGANATFDVGNLLLTTLDPVFDPQTGEFFAFNTYNLTQATTPGSAITVLPGAQINAPNEGSYIAMAVPRVEQGGTVRVNGAAAYVAAEAVDLSINNGLFDIFISSGTSDVQGVVHTGSTGGPASTVAGDNHRIYMVAVPKNQALTMLLEGNVGFDVPTGARVGTSSGSA